MNLFVYKQTEIHRMNKENLMYFGTHEDIPKKPHKFNFNF
ncbi:hypothetical protein ECSTECEH250_0007 [Escherichia coli STEC_EH250]|nr:hypothetical protein ECSTECEH250_0007 [Escherichia coli STEC_EH250]